MCLQDTVTKEDLVDHWLETQRRQKQKTTVVDKQVRAHISCICTHC